jgi:very-short-patch-repair endonuclease
VCLQRRLIIEADGSQHADNKDDARRDAFLRREQFAVLRFWNNDILARAGSVSDAIFAALLSPHPPTRLAPRGPLPLPQGERG